MDGPSGIPDWRDEAAYQPLLGADRSAFAWEWLRRRADYQEASDEALARRSAGSKGLCEESAALAFGLHAFEDPRRAASAARPVWRAEVHPYVLNAQAEEGLGDPDSLDFNRFGNWATIVQSPGCEHILLSDGQRGVRIDVVGISVQEGAIRLSFRIDGLLRAKPSLLGLSRLVALWERGCFSGRDHGRDRRSRRFVLALRARDGLAAGASHRDLAEVLLTRPGTSLRNWRVEEPSLRSRSQRLARAARMGEANYLLFLR